MERRNAFEELATSARRVLLVAGHVIFRGSLAYALNSEADLWVIGQAATLAGVRENMTVASMADVVVVEQRASDGAVGEALSQLHAANARASVLVLSEDLDAARRACPVRAGVDVLPLHSTAIEEIIGAVYRLAESSVAGRR